MKRKTRVWLGLPSGAVASSIIALFVVLQVATIAYGTRINNIPFIRDYHVTNDVVRDSGLTRDHLVGSETKHAESLDLWMVRFKLYTIEADEVVNIIALARIQPAKMQFDPKFYLYGGAFQYPLGAWYLILSKIGLVHVAPLEQLLAQPQQMDRIWIAGRAFVLSAFAASSFLLFLILIEITSVPIAIAGLVIYLFCPASIMFSQVIKPHWYALLWVNMALLIIVRAYTRDRLELVSELLLAAAIGLAVGSVMTFSLMALLLWAALAVLVIRGRLSVLALFRVPIVAIAVFLLLNPFYVLNWPAVQAERAAAEGWFHPSTSPAALWAFVHNSLLPGFGLALTLLTFAAVTWQMIYGRAAARLLAAAIVIPVVVIGIVTAGLSTWTVNFRYVPYLLPAALILIALCQWRHRGIFVVLCAIATIAQAVPLKLAYFDENSDTHSTRLLSAAWIDANIPKEDTICLTINTLAPYEVPPFRFDQRKINSPDCRWTVRVERDPLAATIDSSYTLAKRFVPRLSPQIFPLVWEHINPQITIYRKNV